MSNPTALDWKREEREQLPPFQGSQIPGVGLGNQAAQAPVVSPVQDYHSPQLQIQCFNGHPLMYWTFVRSFDEHIARKMPSESAKLVYLLQQCSPDIRQKLEHISRNLNGGYRLAPESSPNKFVQPHIIAYCCEERLLDMLHLKVKKPSELKRFGVMFNVTLRNTEIRDPETLEKLFEKFPREVSIYL